MASRRFTLEEANRLIPRLEMLMARLQRAASSVRSAVHESETDDAVRTTADVLRVRPELAAHVQAIEDAVAEIERLGGQFKGLDLGLVDFLGEVEGRPVLWCWQYGEKSIGFWHAIDEGFAGRQAIPRGTAPQLQ